MHKDFLIENLELGVEVQQEHFKTTSSIWLVKTLKVLIRINVPDYVLILNLYLPIDENDEMNESEDNTCNRY